MSIHYTYVGKFSGYPIFLARNFKDVTQEVKSEILIYIKNNPDLKNNMVHWQKEIVAKVVIIATMNESRTISLDYDLDVNLSKIDQLLISQKEKTDLTKFKK